MTNDDEQVERVARAMKDSAAVCSSGHMLATMDFTDYEWRWLARAAIEAMQSEGDDVPQEPRDAAQDNVVLEARVRFTAHFPEPYDNLDHIKFRYNEGTWCADNLIDDMKAFATDQGCACDMVERVDVISINGAAVNEPDTGIPIHPTALAEKGIPGLATRGVEGE